MPTTTIASEPRGRTNPARTIRLVDGARLTVTSHVPEDLGDRRAAVAGAQLYVFAGHLRDPHQQLTGVLAGYVGISAGLYRADASYRRWVIQQRRLEPTGMALLHRDRSYSGDALRFIEARTILSLSALHNIATLNTQSAATLAGTRLSRSEVIAAVVLVDELVGHLHEHLYGHSANAPTAPAGNSREAAIRCVRAANRGLDIADLTERLTAAGWHPDASTPGRSIRRDLTQRLDRGRPPVHVTWHRGQRIWYHPDLGKREALRRYDRAKPRR